MMMIIRHKQGVLLFVSLHKRKGKRGYSRTDASPEAVYCLEHRSSPSQESGADGCRSHGHVRRWSRQCRKPRFYFAFIRQNCPMTIF